MDEASEMVLKWHYSRRIPANVQFVGSLHRDGGLFGGDGEMVACAFFCIPPTRWAEPVLELARLVRAGDRVPLTMLIARCAKALKAKHDLLVSFADRTQGHEGIVYRAANWNYAGLRGERQDGLIVNGAFVPGRSCNSKWGTRSPHKLRQILRSAEVEPHMDMGKHCYWLALGKAGAEKAKRLGLFA